MSRLTKTLLLALLIIALVMLIISCAKKTTGPGSIDPYDDFVDKLNECDWSIVIRTDGNYDCIYRKYIPSSTIPIVYLNVNGINYHFTRHSEPDYIAEFGRYFMSFYLDDRPAPLTSGDLHQITLTVNGVSTGTSLEMAYPIIITEAPATFNHARDNIFRWQQVKNSAIIEFVFRWYIDGERNGSIDKIAPYFGSYVVPVNTVPANWESISINVFAYNFNIVGKTAFALYDRKNMYYDSYSITDVVNDVGKDSLYIKNIFSQMRDIRTKVE